MMDVKRDIPAEGSGDDLEAQARAWIVRLRSGAATELDLLRLAEWRAASPAAEVAFERARRLWAGLGSALTTDAEARVVPLRRPPMTRRAALIGGGALAAGVAGLAYLGAAPTGGGRDHETLLATAKGEQRTVSLGTGVTADLNTATRARLWTAEAGRGLELLRGEVLVTIAETATPGRFVARVGPAVAMAEAAQFVLRRDGADASILCLQGSVLVEQAGSRLTLGPRTLLRMGEGAAELVRSSEVADAVAWRSRQLVYENRALGEVIEELNRYRPGRIVLRDGGLASRRVSGVVHLDRIDGALTNFARSLDAKLTKLPGGIVILG